MTKFTNYLRFQNEFTWEIYGLKCKLLDNLQGNVATSNSKRESALEFGEYNSTPQKDRYAGRRTHMASTYDALPYLSKKTLKSDYFLEFTAVEIGSKILFLSKERCLLYKKNPVLVSSNRHLTELCTGCLYTYTGCFTISDSSLEFNKLTCYLFVHL
jgi:hypothetical protein